MKTDTGTVRVADLASGMTKLKAFQELLTEKEVKAILEEYYADTEEEIDFEAFLRVSYSQLYLVQVFLLAKCSALSGLINILQITEVCGDISVEWMWSSRIFLSHSDFLHYPRH